MKTIDDVLAQRDAEHRIYGYLLAFLLRADRIAVRRAIMRTLSRKEGDDA